MPRIAQKMFQARAWLHYWLEAVNSHSLQAPFVFSLYKEVIQTEDKGLPAVEDLRRKLLSSNEYLLIQELGAGSSINASPRRAVASIARHSLTPLRFSLLLHRLIRFNQAHTILELGTSLGINTLYLADAAPAGTVYTIEGCPQTAALAQQHFNQLGAHNVSLHQGNIDTLLPALLQQLPTLDLIYLDANHTQEATLRYFSWLLPHLHEDSVVVVDDIHWSRGMQNAWNLLCEHPSVSLSLDVYEAGLLFFKKNLHKQHYIVEF